LTGISSLRPNRIVVGPLLAKKTRTFVRSRNERDCTLIVFSIQIVPRDQQRTTLLRTLGSLLGPTRVAPGCLDARLYSDLDKPQTLLFVEEWETRQQFERNLDTDRLRAIVAAIELSGEAPVIHVDVVERQTGVDTLGLHRSGISDFDQ
jgi:quinol monooxygenase YgiN